MKRKAVKQHLDLFEQDKEPVRVPPGLRKDADSDEAARV